MRRVAILLVVVLALLLAGCTRVSVSDVNSDPSKYLGKKIIVTGEVSAPLDIGITSGFMIKQDKSSIMVKSDDVPERGEIVTVKGTLVEGMFSGHYIYADSVQ